MASKNNDIIPKVATIKAANTKAPLEFHRLENKFKQITIDKKTNDERVFVRENEKNGIIFFKKNFIRF